MASSRSTTSTKSKCSLAAADADCFSPCAACPSNAYNTLKGEGQWDLVWIGASCKQIMGADGKSQIPAWVWLADNSAVLDGYINLDFGVDPSTCQAGQSLYLNGTAYNGKWRAGSGTDRLGEHLDDILLSSPT